MVANAHQTTHTLCQTLPDMFQQGKLSHQFYHQNAPALARMFKISNQQARAIVTTCPNCQSFALPSRVTGTNLRGLGSLELWQSDITHFAPFGRLKYLHVSVDTFPDVIFASAHAGEKVKDVIKHFYQAFTMLSVPKNIKTDDSPAYSSKIFKEFL